MSIILPFYWSTKKIALDDEQYFVDTIADCLQDKDNNIYSTDPDSVSQILSIQDFDFSWFIAKLGLGNYSEQNLNINYKAISSIADEPKRFNIFSVLIIDYNMPKTLGTDFCKKIDSSLGIRNILLTGNVDYKNGVEFLNQKQIHSFLSKSDLSVGELRKMVLSEEEEFFKYHSSKVTDLIKRSDPKNPIFLEEYKTYFDQMIVKHDIREYYMLNDQGWFLLIDNDCNKKILCLFSEEELEAMYEEAEYMELEEDLCNKIRERKLALCYHSDQNGEWPEVSKWVNHLHNIETIFVSKQKYYAAIIDV